MVRLWEDIPPESINELFSDYLFKIKRWANGHDVPPQGFGSEHIDLFKGIRESDRATRRTGGRCHISTRRTTPTTSARRTPPSSGTAPCRAVALPIPDRPTRHQRRDVLPHGSSTTTIWACAVACSATTLPRMRPSRLDQLKTTLEDLDLHRKKLDPPLGPQPVRLPAPLLRRPLRRPGPGPRSHPHRAILRWRSACSRSRFAV